MIRVALIDDHAVVREGYRSLIDAQADMHVAAEFGDAAAAYTGLRDSAIDVAVMDLNMPGAGPLETLARLHRREPRLRSLVFTMYNRPDFADQVTDGFKLAAPMMHFITDALELPF